MLIDIQSKFKTSLTCFLKLFNMHTVESLIFLGAKIRGLSNVDT